MGAWPTSVLWRAFRLGLTRFISVLQAATSAVPGALPEAYVLSQVHWALPSNDSCLQTKTDMAPYVIQVSLPSWEQTYVQTRIRGCNFHVMELTMCFHIAGLHDFKCPSGL